MLLNFYCYNQNDMVFIKKTTKLQLQYMLEIAKQHFNS